MKSFYRFLFVIFFLNLGGFCFAEFLYESNASCISAPLRIREQATTSSEILGVLQEGDQVEVLSRTFYLDTIGKYNNFWYYIRKNDGLKGYVYGEFININELKYNDFIEMADGDIVDSSIFFNEVHGTGYLLHNMVIHYADSDKVEIANGYYNRVSIELDSRQVYVMNESGEYGWIDLDDFAQTQPNSYAMLEDNDSKDMWFYNSIEKEYKLRESNNIRRIGPILQYSSNGCLFEYVDHDEAWGYFIDEIINSNYFVLKVIYIDAVYYRLVNSISGESFNFYGPVQFSPNKTFAFGLGHSSMYDTEPTINICSLNADSFTEEFEYMFDKNVEASWSVNDIIFLVDDNENPYGELKRVDEKWEKSSH